MSAATTVCVEVEWEAKEKNPTGQTHLFIYFGKACDIR